MSCHMTAASPQKSQISPMFMGDSIPMPGSDGWMRWYQNPKCGDRFDNKTTQTDFSLQMAIGLQNFRSWRNAGSKHEAREYKAKAVPARASEMKWEKNVNPLTDEVEILRYNKQ